MKRKPTTYKYARLTISMDEETGSRVAQAAKDAGLNVSGWARQILVRELREAKAARR